MRRFLILIFAAFVLVFVGVSEAKLVGYWSFDDANNLGKDSSGNNNNGTVKNNATWSNNGKYGGCAHLNMADKAHIVVPHSDSLNMTQALTIEAWINLDSVGSWMSFGTKGDITWAGFIYPQGYLIMYIGGTRIGEGLGKANAIQPNKWQHIVVSFDVKDRIKFYIDGNQALDLAPVGPIPPSTEPLIIGGTGHDGVFNRDAFNGYIDELKIYDHQLTAQEVNESMAGTSAVGLIGKLATNWGTLKMGL